VKHRPAAINARQGATAHKEDELGWTACGEGLWLPLGPDIKHQEPNGAPVGSGRPSPWHGYAVACIGQPPPPSAPGPVWEW